MGLNLSEISLPRGLVAAGSIVAAVTLAGCSPGAETPPITEQAGLPRPTATPLLDMGPLLPSPTPAAELRLPEQGRPIAKIAADIQSLEAKYGPGYPLQFLEDNPDVDRILELSRELVNTGLAWASTDHQTPDITVVYNEPDFVAAISQYGDSKEIQAYYAGYAGGVSFNHQGQPMAILYLDIRGVIPYYNKGYGPLEVIRMLAMHEQAHLNDVQKELTPAEYVTLPLEDGSTITMTALDGARFTEYLPETLQPVGAALNNFSEAVLDWEIVKLAEKAGLKAKPSPNYEQSIENLKLLIRKVGQDPNKVLASFAAKRRAGNPFGIIDEIAGYAGVSSQLSAKDKTIWGIVVLEQATNGRFEIVDRLLTNPTSIGDKQGLLPLETVLVSPKAQDPDFTTAYLWGIPTVFTTVASSERFKPRRQRKPRRRGQRLAQQRKALRPTQTPLAG